MHICCDNRQARASMMGAARHDGEPLHSKTAPEGAVGPDNSGGANEKIASLAPIGKARPVTRTIAYIDGFNLYHGLHDRFGRRYLWLDLVKLVRRLRPHDDVVVVRYFTAMVISDGDAAFRQQTYVDALRTQSGSSLDVVMGRYQQKQMTCRKCGINWTAYEEKETDVNMAVALITDAALGEHDLSLILSADSDLCPAIRAVRDISPELGILAVFPPRRSSFEIRSLVPGSFTLGHYKIRQSLLPDTLGYPTGSVTFQRPERWK